MIEIKKAVDAVFYSVPQPSMLIEKYEEAWGKECTKCGNRAVPVQDKKYFHCLGCDDMISRDAVTEVD